MKELISKIEDLQCLKGNQSNEWGYDECKKDVIELIKNKIQENVSNRRELLISFANYCEREWNCTEVPDDVIDEFLGIN